MYRLLPNALHFSEFQGGYHGTCGEDALATAMVCSTPQIETTADAIALLLSLTHDLISLGWASSNGSTTTQRLHDEAIRRGFAVDASTFIPYHEPLDLTTLHPLLLSTAGIKPILLEIARASNLPGDESGVQYHFICIVGITDAGYICNDGDNANIGKQLVTYSWSQIANARPCGVMVMEMQPATTQGVKTVGIPAGWTDDGVTLKAPNGKRVTQGFRDQVLAWPGGWEADNVPLEDATGESPSRLGLSGAHATRQTFAYRMLGWSDTDGVRNIWMGVMFLADEGQIASLNGQIAALKNQPAPAPIVQQVPTPVDPAVKQALQDAIAVLAPQVNLAQELAQAVAKLS